MLVIRVAVVGTGAMGKGIVEVIRKFDDMEVVAIADINQNALDQTVPYLKGEALVTKSARAGLPDKPWNPVLLSDHTEISTDNRKMN